MIVIRKMEPADCEAVYQIAKQTLPEHWSLEEICRVLQYDYNIYNVAYRAEDSCVVGFAGIMVINEDAELLNIAVSEEFQKIGIGLLLLQSVIVEARRHLAERMLLEVRESNEKARRLYCQNGFCELGIRKNYYTQPNENAIIMSCPLQL